MQVRHLSHIVFIANIAAPGVVSPSGTVHLSASENHTYPDPTYTGHTPISRPLHTSMRPVRRGVTAR